MFASPLKDGVIVLIIVLLFFGPKRLPALSRSIGESIKDYEATGWTGIVVPAKTPPDVIATLNSAIVQALKSPELQQAFEKQAAEPVGSTPAEFGAFIRKETDKWGKTIREAGISVE